MFCSISELLFLFLLMRCKKMESLCLLTIRRRSRHRPPDARQTSCFALLAPSDILSEQQVQCRRGDSMSQLGDSFSQCSLLHQCAAMHSQSFGGDSTRARERAQLAATESWAANGGVNPDVLRAGAHLSPAGLVVRRRGEKQRERGSRSLLLPPIAGRLAGELLVLAMRVVGERDGGKE